MTSLRSVLCRLLLLASVASARSVAGDGPSARSNALAAAADVEPRTLGGDHVVVELLHVEEGEGPDRHGKKELLEAGGKPVYVEGFADAGELYTADGLETAVFFGEERQAVLDMERKREELGGTSRAFREYLASDGLRRAGGVGAGGFPAVTRGLLDKYAALGGVMWVEGYKWALLAQGKVVVSEELEEGEPVGEKKEG